MVRRRPRRPTASSGRPSQGPRGEPAHGATRATEGTELDDELEPFDRLSLALVRLEPIPLEEVQEAVRRFAAAVEVHLGRDGPPARGSGALYAQSAGRLGRLALEHERFPSSVEELRSLLVVVEGDDHGGHRQALGQYGRLLVEALRSHRAEEQGLRPGRVLRASGGVSVADEQP